MRQLLTFSRQEPVQAQPIRIGEAVARTERLLRRLIGVEITLEVHAESPGSTVLADPAQIEQIVLNLAVNARDVMLTPAHGHSRMGGTQVVEVDEVALSATRANAFGGVAPGQYARLIMRDDRHGMDKATQARIFEPFFTTKDVGAGTGLGLAIMFGIARQLSGTIRVRSTAGAGTTFTVLPPVRLPLPLGLDDPSRSHAVVAADAPGR